MVNSLKYKLMVAMLSLSIFGKKYLKIRYVANPEAHYAKNISYNFLLNEFQYDNIFLSIVDIL